MNRTLSKVQKIKLCIATKIVKTIENNIENFEIKKEFSAQINKKKSKKWNNTIYGKKIFPFIQGPFIKAKCGADKNVFKISEMKITLQKG